MAASAASTSPSSLARSPKRSASRTVAQYPAAQRLTARACVHCHNVYDFRREALQAAGKWRLDEVWGYEQFPTTRTVDTHVLRLRQKLERDPDRPAWIVTVHRQGYKFATPQ